MKAYDTASDVTYEPSLPFTGSVCRDTVLTGAENVGDSMLHVLKSLSTVYMYMSHFAYACKMRYPLNLVLENIEYLWFYWTFLHCNFRLWFRTPQPFNSYPCHASEVTRNTLNHCLKFTVRSIFCHICYGKISEKNVNTFFKVKLFVSKTSDSCFQGFDLFQMLLASHS